MHNYDSKGGNRMKWGMILCCGLPLLVVIIWAFGGKAIGAFSWVTWGGIVLMVGVHIVMMMGSHKQDRNENDSKESGGDTTKVEEVNKKPYSGGGCCH